MEEFNLIASLIGILAAFIPATVWLWHRRPMRWGKPLLIFVSMGGTCRDPMAKAIVQYLLAGRGSNISVAAAGLIKGGFPGASPAARRIIEEKLGIDLLASHRSTSLTGWQIRRAKLILVMSRENKMVILKGHASQSAKIYTLKEFLGRKGDVKNPYVENDHISEAAMERYRACFDELFELLSGENLERIYDAVTV